MEVKLQGEKTRMFRMPSPLYQWLKRRATTNLRSVNMELRMILENVQSYEKRTGLNQEPSHDNAE